MAKEHPDIVRRFLAAFAKGGATWDAASFDAEGKRKNQPDADEMIGIVAKALNEPPAVVARGVGYFDPQNRIALSNIQDVLDWYQANGKIKTHMDATALIDQRFATYVEVGPVSTQIEPSASVGAKRGRPTEVKLGTGRYRYLLCEKNRSTD